MKSSFVERNAEIHCDLNEYNVIMSIKVDGTFAVAEDTEMLITYVRSMSVSNFISRQWATLVSGYVIVQLCFHCT